MKRKKSKKQGQKYGKKLLKSRNYEKFFWTSIWYEEDWNMNTSAMLSFL